MPAAESLESAGPSPIEIMLGNMNRLDFFDFFLVWILFFVIIYAILKRSEFSEELSVNALIALVLSFFIINYTPMGMTLGLFFSKLFGLAAVIIAGLLVGILFLGMAGIKIDEVFGKTNKTAVAILLGFLALITFISVGGLGFFNVSSDLVITLFMILLMVFTVMFLAKDGD